MISAILFDLDETILDRRASLNDFLSWQFDKHYFKHQSLKSRWTDRFIELDDYGSRWKNEVYDLLEQEFGLLEAEKEVLLEEYICEFRKFSTSNLHVDSVIRRIVDCELKIGLITNGKYPFQYNNFQTLSVSKLFNLVVVSEKIGIKKPDPRIFEFACEQLNISANTAIFVGDNPYTDIDGANAIGMLSVFLKNRRFHECGHADYQISTFAELPAIIERHHNKSQQRTN